MIDREPELLLLFMEFWAYGVRDPQVRPKVAERFAQMRQVLTQLIADGVREFDLELALPAEQLAVAIDALADGIARQKLADPEAVQAKTRVVDGERPPGQGRGEPMNGRP